MAARYWVGGTGNWNDTAHWSNASGGAGGQAVPTSADDVTMDGSSFSATGQIVTIDKTGSTIKACKSFDMSTATNTPTLQISISTSIVLFTCYGNFTLNTSMSFTYVGPQLVGSALPADIVFLNTGASTMDLKGQAIPSPVLLAFENSGTLTFNSDVTAIGIYLLNGSIITSNHTLNIHFFSSTSTDTMNLGSSTINISTPVSSVDTGFQIGASGASVTHTGLININYSGTGATVSGADINLQGQTIGKVLFNGTSNISNYYSIIDGTGTGSTITTLDFLAGNFIFMSGKINCTSFVANGSAGSGNAITLRSTTLGTQYTISATTASVSYVDVQDSKALGTANPFYDTNGTNSGNNTNWVFAASAVNTYTLKTSISEAPTDLLTFTPTLDPQKSVDFQINAKGTGDWTVTVHDQQNRTIATQTITNANLVSSGYQEFIYSTPWRIVIGKTYHMHLTSTVGDGSIVVATANNFSTANYHTYYGFLVTDTQYHPAIPFLNFIAIGNERYIAKWDGAFYNANFIALPPAWKVRCFGYWREYLAVGMWRGGNIYDIDRGRIYFWDGIAPTFNFFIDVPDGQINALFGNDSDLYMVAGYRGYILDYQGGYFYNTGNSKSSKLKRLPLLQTSDFVEIFPGAMNMWRNLIYIGVAGASNSTTLQKGAYSWGTYNQNYADSLSLDFPISTGNYLNTVSIGMVYPVGLNFILGWQDGISFGADVVNYNNNPAPSGELQLMIQDDQAVWHQKENFDVRADFLALRLGESVDAKIKVDRASSWTVSPIDSTVNDTFVKLPVGTGRGREYQIGIDMFATGTTSPTVIGLSILNEPTTEEQIF